MKPVALRLSGLNPFANMRQIFDGNRKSGAFGGSNDLLTYAVVHVLSKPSLLARKSLKSPFCGFGPSPLKSSLTLRQAMPDALYAISGIRTTEAIKGQVDDTEVNTKHSLNIDFLGVGHVANARKIPLAANEHQVGLTFSVSEQRSLSGAANEIDLLAAAKCPDIHAIVAHETQDAVVIWLRGVLPERAKAVGLVCASSSVGVSDLGDAPHRGLGGQAEILARSRVSLLVQRVLLCFPGSVSGMRQPVARVIATLKCFPERALLITRWLQLNVGDQLHFIKYRRFWHGPLEGSVMHGA